MNYNHQHHKKSCWYPKYQLMFLFCSEQDLVLLNKCGLQEKRNMKSPAISPPINDPIINQYITIIITQQDLILPTLLSKGPTGYKPFIDDTPFSNKIEDEHTDLTDSLGTDN